MPRLIVNAGAPGAWEIQLKPGSNLVGRGFANDFKIDDPSVSSSHCEIVVQPGNVLIKDLGSTNGTFVNRAPVKETSLQNGQTVHLGSVELLFQADAPAVRLAASASSASAPPPTPAASIRVAVAAPPPPRPAASPRLSVASSPPPVPGGGMRLAAAAVEEEPSASPVGAPVSRFGALMEARPCKFHPKTMGRHYCGKCALCYCDLCVDSRMAGGTPHKFCRRCGGEVSPVKAGVQRGPATKGFFSRLPGAFAYPVKGSGSMALIIAAILISGIQLMLGSRAMTMMGIATVRTGFMLSWWRLGLQVIFLGYLFAWMQSIIHSTAVGDEEMPSLPSMANLWEDIVLPFLELLGLGLICFGPAIVLGWFLITSGESSMAWVVMAGLALGAIYFPMAFLAVAMLDSVMAANPLQVVPSILKVPLEYLITLIVLGVVMALRQLGDPVLEILFPRGILTHSPTKLAGFLGALAFWSIAKLYLLAVGIRILGLLYLTRKQKLGWLDH